MAQHDYVINNDTAANVRADINSALSAIASSNSGGAEPVVTYANMFWYDTSTDTLKIRSEADDAWINVAYLNQATDQSFPIVGGVAVTATGTELNYVGGVSSAIQTQLNAKLASTNPAITGTPVEDVYAISGTSVALEPDNGSVQTHALTANTTYTDAFSAGQAITLMINDGAARTVTWPAITWVNNGAVAPTLATSGYTVLALWKVSTVLYGALVGDGS